MAWHLTHPALLPLPAGCVAALGNFDGVHAGHQALLAHARTLAVAANLPLVVLTFNPHPRTVLRPEEPFKHLQTLPEKITNLHAQGVEGVAVVPFTKDFSGLSPTQFIEDILITWLSARTVVVGENFRFGHKAAGNTQSLRATPAFATHVLSLLADAEGPYSSSRLRAAQHP